MDLLQHKLQRWAAIGGIPGGLIGLSIGYCEFWFFDSWNGAVLGSCLVILVQLWRTHNDATFQFPPSRRIGIFVVVAIFAVFALQNLAQVARAKSYIRQFQSLPLNSIQKIEIRPYATAKDFTVVDNPEELNEFVDSVHDIQLHYSGKGVRPIYRQSLILEMKSGHHFDMGIVYDAGHPEIVQGYLLDRASTSSAEFKSTRLVKWFANHRTGD